MTRVIVFMACLIAVEVSASGWRPSDRFLHAVRHVESAGGLYTWGDDGRSLGEYQLSEAAWLDVNAWRRVRRLPLFDYRTDVWDPEISRMYAADYLSILHGELKKRLKRVPTAPEVYAAYNMGLASFAQCQYKLTRVNSVTARKCVLIKALINGS
ncbi:MAG: hypothetical protein AB9869_34575 [Verrucomicrobiia bacterium]